MDEMTLPKDGANPYANHPGFTAHDCDLRYTVTQRNPWGVIGNCGFGCQISGAHCLPNGECEGRKARYKERQEFMSHLDSLRSNNRLDGPAKVKEDGDVRRTRNKARRDAICARMREAKERLRMEAAEALGNPSHRFTPPVLRRVVIVIDYDIETKIEVFRLRRTSRIDSYSLEHNGKAIDGRIGWSNFCKRLSAYFPRLLSPLSG